MHEIKTLDRRTFTLEAALAILSGVAITISSGCGGGSGYNPGTPSTPAPTPTPATGDKVGSISANHGHSAIIVAAQLTAASAISLDIRGSSDHTHNVELSAAEINAIAGNQRVSKGSSGSSGGSYGDHSHTVTFN
jgi:hypothetical protein